LAPLALYSIAENERDVQKMVGKVYVYRKKNKCVLVRVCGQFFCQRVPEPKKKEGGGKVKEKK